MALIEWPQGRRHPSCPNTESRSTYAKLRLQFITFGSLSLQYPINEGGPVPETWKDKSDRKLLG